jgi:hypothetical protein
LWRHVEAVEGLLLLLVRLLAPLGLLLRCDPRLPLAAVLEDKK